MSNHTVVGRWQVYPQPELREKDKLREAGGKAAAFGEARALNAEYLRK